jgi:hypothetical protein
MRKHLDSNVGKDLCTAARMDESFTSFIGDEAFCGAIAHKKPLKIVEKIHAVTCKRCQWEIDRCIEEIEHQGYHRGIAWIIGKYKEERDRVKEIYKENKLKKFL